MKDVLFGLLVVIAYGFAVYLINTWADKKRKDMLREYDESMKKIDRDHEAKLKEIERNHEKAMRSIAKKYDFDEWQDVANRIAQEIREAMSHRSLPQRIRIDLDVQENRVAPIPMRKAN